MLSAPVDTVGRRNVVVADGIRQWPPPSILCHCGESPPPPPPRHGPVARTVDSSTACGASATTGPADDVAAASVANPNSAQLVQGLARFLRPLFRMWSGAPFPVLPRPVPSRPIVPRPVSSRPVSDQFARRRKGVNVSKCYHGKKLMDKDAQLRDGVGWRRCS